VDNVLLDAVLSRHLEANDRADDEALAGNHLTAEGTAESKAAHLLIKLGAQRIDRRDRDRTRVYTHPTAAVLYAPIAAAALLAGEAVKKADTPGATIRRLQAKALRGAAVRSGHRVGRGRHRYRLCDRHRLRDGHRRCARLLREHVRAFFLVLRFQKKHAFAVCIRTENQNQPSFSPFGPHEISVLIELKIGRLRYFFTDVPPQPISQPVCVPDVDRPKPLD